VAWLAPENKRLSESYLTIQNILEPVKHSSDKTRGIIRTISGGLVEFWSMEDENACRSRKYHRVIFDEAAFSKPKAIDLWERSVKPTLLDYGGSCLMMSNTNGNDPDNLFWQVCNEDKHGFTQYHAPSHSNPYLPQAELDKLIRENHPLVYRQEYLAEFVDFSGDAFFPRDKLLIDGQPVSYPVRCEAVFAIVDTATKTGKEHDGTAVVYYALVRNRARLVGPDGAAVGHPYQLVILDWDVMQLEGYLLETWLPNVFSQLEGFALSCRAMNGSLGAQIEDKNSGSVLIQQCQARGLPGRPIESKLTSLGKDERALFVSSYYHQGNVKISRHAFEKVTQYKGASRNHFLAQLENYRIGDKDRNREDDLADCAMYGCAMVCADAEWT